MTFVGIGALRVNYVMTLDDVRLYKTCNAPIGGETVEMH